jgi:hypothetical protein
MQPGGGHPARRSTSQGKMLENAANPTCGAHPRDGRPSFYTGDGVLRSENTLLGAVLPLQVIFESSSLKAVGVN